MSNELNHSIFDIPNHLVNKLDAEQKAMFKLLDDEDEEIFNHISEKLYTNESSIYNQIFESILDFAQTTNNELLNKRIKFILQSQKYFKIEKIINTGEISLHNLLEILLLIDEMILMRKIDHQFFWDEIDGMKKQFWLHTNHFMAPDIQIASFNSIFYHQLNFSLNHEIDNLEKNTFTYSLYNKQGSAFMVWLHYYLMANFVGLDLKIFFYSPQYTYLFYFSEIENKILFFMDTSSGFMLSEDEVKMICIKYEVDFYKLLKTDIDTATILKIYIENLIEFEKVSDDENLEKLLKKITRNL